MSPTVTNASSTRTRSSSSSSSSSRKMNGTNNEILSFLSNSHMKNKVNVQPPSTFGTRRMIEFSKLEESTSTSTISTRRRSVSSSKHYNDKLRRNAIANQESFTNDNTRAEAFINKHERTTVSKSCFGLVQSIQDSLNEMKKESFPSL